MQTEKGRSEHSREMKRGAPKLSTREGMSRFRDDKRKPDQEKVASSDNDAKIKQRQGEKDVQTSSKQPEDSEMSGASRIEKKWQHQTSWGKKQMSKTKSSKKSRNHLPCQPGAPSFLRALPCLYNLFSFSKLPPPGLLGLYLYDSSTLY